MSDVDSADDEPPLVDPSEEEGEEEAAEPEVPALTALEEKAAGNAAFKSRRYRDAIEAYTRAIALDGTVAAFYGNRAQCQFHLRDYAAALADNRKSIEVDGRFVKGYVRAGSCHIKLGELEEAAEQFESARREDTGNNMEAIRSGKVVKELQSKAEAADAALASGDYARARTLGAQLYGECPASVRMGLIKVEALVNDHRAGEACKVCSELMSHHGQTVQLLAQRGKCLHYCGNTEQAQAHLQRALQNDPDYRDAQILLKTIRKLERAKAAANASFKAGRYAEAVEGYGTALEIDPSNDDLNSKLHCNRANASNKLGKFEDAVKDATAAIELNEGYAKAYGMRGGAYLELEHYESSIADYDKASELSDGEEYDRLLRKAKLELKKSKRKNLYKILGVAKTVNERDIKKAYRKSALVWHPDKHGMDTDKEQAHAEKMFKDIGEAYAILSDPQKRERYDQGMDIEDIEQGGGMGGFGGGGGGPDVNDIFASMFAGGGGMGGGFGGGHGHGHGRRPGGF